LSGKQKEEEENMMMMMMMHIDGLGNRLIKYGALED